MNPPLLAALAYVRRGWSVIPLWPRQKRPLIPWAAYQRARADETEVREWYDRWPDANVGIVTGAVSSLVVLDVDPFHGGDRSIEELKRAHGHLPCRGKHGGWWQTCLLGPPGRARAQPGGPGSWARPARRWGVRRGSAFCAPFGAALCVGTVPSTRGGASRANAVVGPSPGQTERAAWPSPRTLAPSGPRGRARGRAEQLDRVAGGTSALAWRRPQGHPRPSALLERNPLSPTAL
jgi:bifunctional DNA primase/polymerase-like protein